MSEDYVTIELTEPINGVSQLGFPKTMSEMKWQMLFVNFKDLT